MPLHPVVAPNSTVVKLSYTMIGDRTITKYMQDIKSNIDAPALMDVVMDFDELSIRMLDGLDQHYKDLVDIIVT